MAQGKGVNRAAGEVAELTILENIGQPNLWSGIGRGFEKPHRDDGGAGKWGHYGREKGASDVVTLWPAGGATGPDVKWQFV